MRGKIPPQKSFSDWIRAINAEKAKLSSKDYVRSINEGFAEAKRFGTTTMANLTAFPELVSQVEAPIRTWWFAELIDVRDPARASELVDFAVERLKSQKHWGLAPHAPFTASAELYRCCEEVARHNNILLSTHLAESREELLMFQDASGALYEFLKEIGREMTDCGKGTAVERFLTIGGTVPYLLVHLNELKGGDFGRLEKLVDRSSIVHCPRSHQYFGHSPFEFQKLHGLGFNICLGTDSLASNDDLSLFAEMRAFQKKFPGVAPGEILKMVTVNPASALKQERTSWKNSPRISRGPHRDPIAKSTSVFEEIYCIRSSCRLVDA